MGLDRTAIRDRVAKIGLPILIAVAILALIIGAIMSIVVYQVLTDAHGQTSAQEQTIERLLRQHTGDIAALNTEQKHLDAAEQQVTADGNYIVAWQEWAANGLEKLCAQAFVTCAAPPPPP